MKHPIGAALPVPAPLNDHRATLLYDGDCGFCLWTVGVVLRSDHKRTLRPVAIQSVQGARLLAALVPAERVASWHLVLADGRRFSRGAVVPQLLGLLDRGIQARLTAQVAPLTELAYRVVADRRGALGSLLPRAARQRAEALVLERAGEMAAQQPVAPRATPGARPAAASHPRRERRVRTLWWSQPRRWKGNRRPAVPPWDRVPRLPWQ